MTLAGTDAGNYTLTRRHSTTADITARTLTGSDHRRRTRPTTATPAATVSGRSTGVVTGDTVDRRRHRAPSPTRTWAPARPSSVGRLALTGADAGNYKLIDIAARRPRPTSRAKDLTGSVTADDKTYDGTIAATDHRPARPGVGRRRHGLDYRHQRHLRRQERRHRQDRHRHRLALTGDRRRQLQLLTATTTAPRPTSRPRRSPARSPRPTRSTTAPPPPRSSRLARRAWSGPTR